MSSAATSVSRESSVVAAEAEMVADAHRRMTRALGTVIIGQEYVLDLLLTALFCKGHCILEGGLWALNVLSTKVTDFSPIDDLPGLKVLFCDFVEQRDARTLRQAKWLESINGNSVVGFWKLLDSRRTEDLPAKE